MMMTAKEESRMATVALGGWPLGEADGGDVVALLAAGDGGLMAGGIGASATSASVRMGLGASAGGIICGVMSCSNWPGAAGFMYVGVCSAGNPKHRLPAFAKK